MISLVLKQVPFYILQPLYWIIYYCRLWTCNGTPNAIILLPVGATEEGRQQKSWWSLICHCRINWLAWHNYGVSHEDNLSISAIQSFTIVFDLSFFVPTIQAIMRKVKIDQFSRCWFFFFIFAVSFLFFGWITFWR